MWPIVILSSVICITILLSSKLSSGILFELIRCNSMTPPTIYIFLYYIVVLRISRFSPSSTLLNRPRTLLLPSSRLPQNNVISCQIFYGSLKPSSSVLNPFTLLSPLLPILLTNLFIIFYILTYISLL